ncbi:acyltransferase family protein [Mucilaginibacter phyllosphaerae]|uniref:Peptidoglycan/LPS O-acetylase OafA/YrhL n=1 Tax=Mucilaginibacter phyllosphaerae TaxID=1812349 RepID=A0ABR6I6A6_9SPHI|nr:acyltransferase [Mucilaginibacter phyllosphaerae]MBB3968550.1 peptidoglycan/LPS O-acetylase OafA/YrhL [Mucilaginibacter phyllosphaerae]
MKRIPSLDGFRAIAILLVLFSHSRYSSGFPAGWADVARHGGIGVNVFFVISGFLITTLLLNEEQKNGFINLGAFYIRRAIRILPVFFLYTCFILVWQNFEPLNLTKSNLVHVFTFTVNFDKGRNWFLGHYWSLSVEEQFYLLWPLVMVFCRKYIKPFLLLSIVYSCAAHIIDFKFPAYSNITLSPFFNYADAILIGAAGGLLYFENPGILNRKMFNSYPLQFAALGVFVLFIYLSGYGKLAIISLPFSGFFIAAAILYLILSYIRPGGNLVYRLLNSRVMVHIGVLSYSIYIWQQFFFVGQIDFAWRHSPPNILLIYFAGLASYYLWEKPFLKLKQLFAAKQLQAAKQHG